MASTAGAAPRNLSYEAARALVLAAAGPGAVETVALMAAAGRALREDVIAEHDLPPFRNSSMDGFAVRAADLARVDAGAVELPVAGVIAAGQAPARVLAPGEAWRIMTGAMLPEGADAVVPFEETEPASRADAARFIRAAAAGDNVRDAGADLRAGSPVLRAGRELSAHDLALLAALGIPRIAVGARPTATVLSTGDELLDIDAPLRPGAIRDSNTLMLRLLLAEAGCDVLLVERLPDDAARVAARIRHAHERCDVTLTIGGVSMGDYDPVKQSLDALGGVEWWRVAMKPGRPQAFGARDGRLYFGLPGNPASVACVFEALVRPALRARQGFAALGRPVVAVRAAVAIPSRAGRTDFVRVSLARRDDAWWAAPVGAQVSGHLTPQSRAHALLVVPAEREALAPGDPAEAWVLRWPQLGDA